MTTLTLTGLKPLAEGISPVQIGIIDGERWVVKSPSTWTDGNLQRDAELLAYLLGADFGVQVPEVRIVDGYICSKVVDGASHDHDEYSSEYGTECRKARAFDMLIGNNDRHGQNIISSPSGMWFIDHAHATFDPYDFECSLDYVDKRSRLFGLLLDWANEGLISKHLGDEWAGIVMDAALV